MRTEYTKRYGGSQNRKDIPEIDTGGIMAQQPDRFKLHAYVLIGQAKRLRRIAFEREISMSTVVREALDRYFAAIDKQHRRSAA